MENTETILKSIEDIIQSTETSFKILEPQISETNQKPEYFGDSYYYLIGYNDGLKKIKDSLKESSDFDFKIMHNILIELNQKVSKLHPDYAYSFYYMSGFTKAVINICETFMENLKM